MLLYSSRPVGNFRFDFCLFGNSLFFFFNIFCHFAVTLLLLLLLQMLLLLLLNGLCQLPERGRVLLRLPPQLGDAGRKQVFAGIDACRNL
jgi:hypothetical protein